MSSENGWEPAKASPEQCVWVTVPGTGVHLQLLKGQPATIMAAVAADFNAYIEPLRDPDSAGWTPTNAVATSNHLNGTAMDLNWDSHPFRNRGSFDQAQMQTIRELVDYYEGCIFWAGDWDDPVDEMHWQMGYQTYGNRHVEDFINREIRPDGFSKFRRGDTPEVSRQDRYALAVIDEGRRRGISPRGIQIALATALVESNLRMYANSNVPESLNIPHDAVGSDHDSVGLFQQRCPMWGPADVLMNPTLSAGLFYDHLAQLDYNGPKSPGWYAQAVQRSAFPDRYDQRFAEAEQLYNRLTVAPQKPSEEDWMANPELERMIRDVHAALCDQSRSLSRYADDRTWPNSRFPLATDGHVFDLIVEHDAALGDEWSLNQIRVAAAKGDKIAAAFLHRLTTAPTPTPGQQPPAAAPAAPPSTTPPTTTPDSSPPQQSNGSLSQAIEQFSQELQQIKTTLSRLIG